MSFTYICTVKNGERYAQDCIESVFRSDPNCELIVVDDGSTDGTQELIKRLRRTYPKLRYIETEGVGRGRALNIALERADTSFVANIDIDDIALPGRSRLVEWLQNSEALKYAVCSGDQLVVESEPDYSQYFNEEEMLYSQKGLVKDVTSGLVRKNCVSHVAFVAKKSCISEVGGYNETLNSQLDYDLWVRLKKHGHRFAKMDGNLVALKRIHSLQSFENKSHLRYICSSLRVQNASAETLNERLLVKIYMCIRLLWALVPRRVRATYWRVRR